MSGMGGGMKIWNDGMNNGIKELAIKAAIKGAALIAVGALLLTGIRLAEWTIPRPDTRIVVCLASDIGEIDECTQLSELMQQSSIRE